MAKQDMAAKYDASLGSIDVEIEGAWLIDAGEGKIKFSLNGVRAVEVNWMKVDAILREAGVEELDTAILVEQMASNTEQHLLAKALAKRMRRV